MSLMCFHLFTQCALHDSHNAFKWSYLSTMADRPMMRDIYIGIESLRNSHDLIEKHLSGWIAQRLTRGPHEDEE